MELEKLVFYLINCGQGIVFKVPNKLVALIVDIVDNVLIL